ncbi:MAG TPA: uroporphyrinogen decarboxylase [Acidobacteriota bacterium]|nr:uroporphyrinogen decarboxylase [Acidobacteriota bacterium]HNJ39288.1 uroporphyrinogen decarboxylase [Acidobacteriota bacterium]
MTLHNDLLLRACRQQPVERPPVWMMRQAGRYLPEYRAVRADIPFMTLCKTPELAVEVSMQPLRIIGVDAVIMFSDILVPVEAMGLDVEITEKIGPRIANPIRSESDIHRLRVPDPVETMPFVFEILRQLRSEIQGAVPLLGFAGAPWTLAAYMIEGGGSKNYIHIKGFMHREPKAFHAMMEKVADTQALYLKAQIEAGAQAIQLFDSWAGELSPADFAEYALPYIQRVFEQVGNQVPRILYLNGTSHLLELMEQSGADVLSIDWRTSLPDARRRTGGRVALQGNLDPCRLLGPREKVVQSVHDILASMKDQPGFILNLGHGILPPTPVENARAFVATGQGRE